MDQKVFVTELLKIADQLDSKGLQIEADEIDAIVKDAQVVSPMYTSDPERRYPGYHLPEWRKLQIEREKKFPTEVKKPDTGVVTTEPAVFQPGAPVA
jgi:hypothetical protein